MPSIVVAMVTVYVSSSSLLSYGENVTLSSLTLADPWIIRPKEIAHDRLLSCGRYIERNPVEAGLVIEPWAYPWSSCRAYTLGEPNRLLATNPWYDQLAMRAARRRQLWREFLLGEDPKEEVVLRQDWATGGERF
jgi:hypothetical protein